LDSVDPTVVELLRLGAYQSLYMGSVPSYAAVSETVDQVKEAVGSKPAGFVNAVLRKVVAAGDGADRFPDPDLDPVGFLVTWGSHPEWLVRRWLERWPLDDVRALVSYDNAKPSVYLVPLDGDPAEAVAALAAEGIIAEEVGEGPCLRLGEGSDVRRALVISGPAIVQDPGANLVSRYADVPSGTMVADLCAAPGGKLLALSGRPSTLLAADRSESRIQMIRENAQRTGRPLQLVVADAMHPPLDRADVVLLDVPCTGTGTLGRHPDARWRLRSDAVSEMAELQAEMLRAAAPVVASGGLLVYSTCSLEWEENQRQVEAFLEGAPEFRLEPTDAVPSRYLDGTGALSVTPQDSGFDGAFAARLRKVA
jgi:16S rRNA (cytosine967-C5)-methyltransferase